MSAGARSGVGLCLVSVSLGRQGQDEHQPIRVMQGLGLVEVSGFIIFTN